jgi:5'-nucleotidase
MHKKEAHILLVNDDGIFAPGLAALYEALQGLGKISVVAPATEKSAVGHAITLSDPLRIYDFHKNGAFFGIAVHGTPADCVKLAVSTLLDEAVDLVVSGINLGSNTGINVIYSGTVSAATEGTLQGIPAFAVSLATYKNPNFVPAMRFARKTAEKLLQSGLPAGTLLNINVPNVADENDIAGVMVTEQSKARWQETFDRRVDPKERVYYWMGGYKVEVDEAPVKDDTAVRNGYISVTPVQFDLTDYQRIAEIEKLNLIY